MDHPKTTTLGIITIAMALLLAAKQYLIGAVPDISTLVAQVAAGAGLISAADSGSSNGM